MRELKMKLRIKSFHLATVIIGLCTLKLLAGIGVGYSPPGILPIELKSFTAKLSGNVVELYWVTTTEVNNYGFEIERACQCANKTQVSWIKIGFVNGRGNSNSPKEYVFIDSNPLLEGALYRLKQIDNNGAFRYSMVLEFGVGLLKDFELFQNFPNPYNPSTVISYIIPSSSNVRIEVYDVLGKLVKTLVNEKQEAGIYKVNFNAGELSNGIYFYKMQAGNFVAIRKMILLK
jgi:hypothetical protein